MKKESTGIRRSDRVTVTVPVEIMGTEAGGGDFFDRAETLKISRHGASVILNRKLAPDQELTLRNLENHKEADVLVIGQIGTVARGEVYGLAFTDDGSHPWDIEFPPLADSDQAAMRAVMACQACKTREVVYLNELEAEVFQASAVLSRACSRCRQSTVWRESAGPEPAPAAAAPADPSLARESRAPRAEAPPQAMAVAESIGSPVEAHAGEEEAPSAPRTQNDRKHGRSKLKIAVCIRRIRDAKDHWGADEEVVETADVSRGGFGFSSDVHYRKGSQVEVAIPYKAGGANIFVPAKIANVRKLKDGRRRYGLAYIPTHQGWPSA